MAGLLVRLTINHIRIYLYYITIPKKCKCQQKDFLGGTRGEAAADQTTAAYQKCAVKFLLDTPIDICYFSRRPITSKETGMHKNRTKYMVACPVVTPHIVEMIREARKILRGKMEAGISTPTFDHVTFGQPFVTSYEEASMISLGIDLSALRLSLGEHPFTLGEVKLFESKVLDTVYLEVNTDEDVTEFLKKMRDGLFSADDIEMLGPRLDDGEPKLHITLFQGRGLLKRSGHLADRIESYNHSLRALKSTDQDHLVVFETFIPVVYARYIPEWKMLSSNPESP